MKQFCAIAALLFLGACSDKAEKASVPLNSAKASQQIEQDAKSIEQAADEAAKVIEEDARTEDAAL
jgi:outer membrane lipoprotein-sorting protein